MKLRNRTSTTPSHILRSGTKIVALKEGGDADVFNRDTSLTLADATGLTGSATNLTLLSRRFGFDFKGTPATGSASYTTDTPPIDAINPFYFDLDFIVIKPETTSATRPSFELQYGSSLSMSVAIEDKGLTLSGFDDEDVFVAKSAGTYSIKMSVYRDITRRMFWSIIVDGDTPLFSRQGMADSSVGAVDLSLSFAGSVTTLGNGRFEFYGLTFKPILTSDTYDDMSPLRIPLCASYSDSEAIFECAPVSPGTHSSLRLYGANSTLGVYEDLEEMECIFDPYSKNNFILMISPVERLYSDEELLALCPIEAEVVESRSDSKLSNICFDDNHPTETTLDVVDIKTVSSGDLKDANNVPEFLFEKNGIRYGRDMDLSQIHPFPLSTVESDLPGLSLIPPGEISPFDCEYRVTRTKILSNNKRLYYGLLSPIMKTEVDLVFIEVTISALNGLALSQDGSTSPLASARIEVYEIGTNSDTVFETAIVSLPYSSSFSLGLPKGHYKILLQPISVTGTFFAFTGTIAVEQQRPLGAFLETTVIASMGANKKVFDSVTEIYFDVKERHGKLWWMLYDQATSSVQRFTITESSYNYYADCYTDSVSAIEVEDGFVLIYKESTQDVFPYLSGLGQKLKYVKHDMDGGFLSSGTIYLDDPTGRDKSVHAFDAVNQNGQFILFYNSNLTSPENRSRDQLVPAGAEEYRSNYLQSEALPFMDTNIFVVSKSLSEMTFELDEILDGPRYGLGLSSLNNLYSTYRSLGFSDGKVGVESEGLDFRPNYKTTAATIRANVDHDFNSIVLSVIDVRYRHPIIFAGSGISYREVCVPSFFGLQYQDKDLTTPFESLDACWNQDGNIWAVASTTHMPTNTRPIGTASFDQSVNEPTFEMMIINPDILKSGELVFLKRDLSSSWNTWSRVRAYDSKYRQTPIQILNNYDNSYEGNVGDLLERTIVGHTRRETVSCQSDRNLFILNQSGTRNSLPRIFQIGRADNLPFTVPLEELYLPEDAEVTSSATKQGGKLLVLDGSLIDTVKTTHLLIEGALESTVLLQHLYDTPSTRNRSFNLAQGTRAKVTIQTDDIVTEDGISIFLLDSDIDQESVIDPHDVTQYAVYLRIYRDVELKAQLYHIPVSTEVVLDEVVIDDSDCFIFDFHLMMRKTGIDKVEVGAIIKKNKYIFGASESSGISGSRPYLTNDNYYQYYNDYCLRMSANSIQAITISGEPSRVLAISNYSGTAQVDNYRLFSVGFGTMAIEGAVENRYINPGIAATPPYNPITTRISGYGLPTHLSQEANILRSSLSKTVIGFPVAAGPYGRTKPLYWNTGFSITASGTTAKVGDHFRLSRTSLDTVDQARSSFLHGKWISSEDNISVKIWADARDSGKQVFHVNKFLLDGCNFSMFNVIVKDAEEDPWTIIRNVDMRDQSFNATLTKANAITNDRYNWSALGIKPTEGPMYLRVEGEEPVVLINKKQTSKINVSVLEEEYDGMENEEKRISLFLSKRQITIPLIKHRFVGIEIIPQKTYEGYYTMNVFDFGYASRITDQFDQDDGSGLSYDHDSQIVYNFDNSPLDVSYKNISKSYKIDYASSDLRTFIKIKSASEKLSLYNKPLWVMSDDPKEFNQVFMESSPSIKTLIDDGDKLYTIGLQFKSTR